MTQSEVLELIRNGENSGVEFKREEVSSEDLAKEIVGFSNFKGGIILLGVDDDGSIRGVTGKSVEERVMNVCRDLVHPGITPWYERIAMEGGKTIAAIKMDQGLNKPYYLERRGRKTYYIRVGSTTREATREELLRLFQASGFLHFDVKPVPRTSVRDLDRSRIFDYFRRIRKLDLEKNNLNLERVLLNSRLLTMSPSGDAPAATVAGLLLFGKDSQRFLPQAGIDVACFEGMEMDYKMADKRKLNAPLVNLYDEEGEVIEKGIINQTLDIIRLNTKIATDLKRGETVREVTYQYPPDSLREALVNAVVHRDYSLYGARVQVFIFSNRIEIRSPGRLPNAVTLESIKIGDSFARNPVLVKFLENYGYMEEVGLGIPLKIIQLALETTGIEPDLEEVGQSFRVTVYALSEKAAQR